MTTNLEISYIQVLVYIRLYLGFDPLLMGDELIYRAVSKSSICTISTKWDVWKSEGFVRGSADIAKVVPNVIYPSEYKILIL